MSKDARAQRANAPEPNDEDEWPWCDWCGRYPEAPLTRFDDDWLCTECYPVDAGIRTLPGHPVAEGSAGECHCGACLALPARRNQTTLHT